MKRAKEILELLDAFPKKSEKIVDAYRALKNEHGKGIVFMNLEDFPNEIVLRLLPITTILDDYEKANSDVGKQVNLDLLDALNSMDEKTDTLLLIMDYNNDPCCLIRIRENISIDGQGTYSFLSLN